MAAVLRGEIVWAELDPVLGHEQGGRRPVLVISHDLLNERSGTLIVLAITSREQAAGHPLAHELRSGGLPRRSWVKATQVRTVSTARVRGPVGVSVHGVDPSGEICDSILSWKSRCRVLNARLVGRHKRCLPICASRSPPSPPRCGTWKRA